jgi:hypothetical protein
MLTVVRFELFSCALAVEGLLGSKALRAASDE